MSNTHDKLSFTREYCKCRRIPYQIKGEALFIDGTQVCFSLLNLSYRDIMEVIDDEVWYDEYGNFYSTALPCW